MAHERELIFGKSIVKVVFDLMKFLYNEMIMSNYYQGTEFVIVRKEGNNGVVYFIDARSARIIANSTDIDATIASCALLESVMTWPIGPASTICCVIVRLDW